MNHPKWIIVILVVVGVAFVVTTSVGVFNDDGNRVTGEEYLAQRKKNPSSNRKEQKKPFWKKIVDSWTPTLKLESIQNLSSKTFKLSADQSRQFNVFGQEGVPFRIATFRIKEGSGVEITYESNDADDGDVNEELRHQPWPEDSDPDKGSLVILEHGGTLMFDNKTKSSRTVILE